jgi:hypothetical protein
MNNRKRLSAVQLLFKEEVFKMKRTGIAIFCVLCFLGFSTFALADCTTIQDGMLTYSAGHYLGGEPLQTGFDPFGYNYQARMFSGSYANTYLGGDGYPPYEGDDDAYAARLAEEGFGTDPYTKWYWPYRDVELAMKWNDAWLSNKDCDDDGKLDRHYGYLSYIGSGAWITNHMSGTYEGGKKMCKWVYFTKIVAVPEDATLVGGIWYTASENEIGPVMWGQFATIQSVYNDPCGGFHGIEYLSPSGPGFGKY